MDLVNYYIKIMKDSLIRVFKNKNKQKKSFLFFFFCDECLSTVAGQEDPVFDLVVFLFSGISFSSLYHKLSSGICNCEFSW